MLKRKEKTRRRRTKFSLFDLIVCLCAGTLLIGSIYYFFIMKNQTAHGELVRNNKSTKAKTKINEGGEKDKEQNVNIPLKKSDAEKNKEKDSKKSKEVKEKEKNEKNDVPGKEKDQTKDVPVPVPGKEKDNTIGKGHDSNNVPFPAPIIEDFNTDVEEIKSDNHSDTEETVDIVNDKNDLIKTDNTQVDAKIETKVKDEMFEYPVCFEVIKSGTIDFLKTSIQEQHKQFLEKSQAGFNALHYAAFLMNFDAMTVLIKANLFDISDKITGGTYKDSSALYLALCAAKTFPTEQALKGVKLLLDSGADFQAKDEVGLTPIFKSVDSGITEIVQLFLDKGENINSILEGSEDSLLHHAMVSCNRPMIKFLIDKGADIKQASGSNRLPIHEAAAVGCVDGLWELILTRRVSKQIPSPSKNENKCKEGYEENCLFGAAPLHFAAKSGELNTTEFLFLIQSEFDARDEDGKMAKYYARTESIKDYFDERLIWENKRSTNQNIEFLLREAEENFSPSEIENFFNEMKWTDLHK